MLEKIKDDPDIFRQIITRDETWVFQYDPETKRQSMQWKTAESLRPKKAHMSKSKIKVMLITFFDQKGMVHYEFVPEGEIVNQHFYQQVLICLHNRVQCSWQELWSDKSWLLHHDNAPIHKAISVRQLLVKNSFWSKTNNSSLHPPYSPDLALCGFWLFPRLKVVMKGTHFLSLEEIKASMMRELKRLKKEDFTKCFHGWQDQMQKCIDLEGEYFEGDNS